MSRIRTNKETRSERGIIDIEIQLR